MSFEFDIFVSHASADKERFVRPLCAAFDTHGLSHWLDAHQIGWGDSVAGKINDGLANSRFVLLCLSKQYSEGTWPQAEMNAALSIQNASGTKRVLPLILNGKGKLLRRYPLLADVAYRHFSAGPSAIAQDIQVLIDNGAAVRKTQDKYRVIVESAHSGVRHEIHADPMASIAWLYRECLSAAGVNERADTGGFVQFKLRWVLVDVNARHDYLAMSRDRQRKCHSVVWMGKETRVCVSSDKRLKHAGFYDGCVLHLHAVEDEYYYEHYAGPEACESAAEEACAE